MIETPAAPASTERPSHSLVCYFGGKWMLAPWIISYFPEHRVYVEPFGGGGSVLLRKPRAHAEVYNDLDGEVVNMFRVVRDDGAKLMRQLELTPFAREEFNGCFQPTQDPVERARRMIARSFLGMGACAHGKQGGFRANTKTVVHSHNWSTFPGKFPPIIDRLRGVIIENRDALEVMAIHDSPTTLHYVDPPYVTSTRISKKVYRHELSDVQQHALADGLNALRGAVIVSGYPCPLYDKLFAGWRRVARAAHAHGNLPRTEVLWLKDARRAGARRKVAAAPLHAVGKPAAPAAVGVAAK